MQVSRPAPRCTRYATQNNEVIIHCELYTETIDFHKEATVVLRKRACKFIIPFDLGVDP